MKQVCIFAAKKINCILSKAWICIKIRSAFMINFFQFCQTRNSTKSYPDVGYINYWTLYKLFEQPNSFISLLLRSFAIINARADQGGERGLRVTGTKISGNKSGEFEKGIAKASANAAMLVGRLIGPDRLCIGKQTIGNRMPSSKLRNPSLLDQTILRPLHAFF